MLVGLVTRNGNFAALAALVCYGAADVVAAMRTQLVESALVNGSMMWKTVLEILWWIAPKTGRSRRSAQASAAPSSGRGFERFRQQLPAAADARRPPTGRPRSSPRSSSA
jgi:hypothetical protein